MSFFILPISLSLKAVIFIAGLQTVLQNSSNYFTGISFPQKSIPLLCLRPGPHILPPGLHLGTTTIEEFE